MSENTITVGSGNVFKDLKIPNPEEALIKADLVMLINRRIQYKELVLQEVSNILKIKEDDLAKLLRGRTEDYKIKELAKYLYAIGGRFN